MPDGLQTHQHPKLHDHMNQFIRITVYFSPLPALLGVCVCRGAIVCVHIYCIGSISLENSETMLFPQFPSWMP